MSIIIILASLKLGRSGIKYEWDRLVSTSCPGEQTYVFQDNYYSDFLPKIYDM